MIYKIWWDLEAEHAAHGCVTGGGEEYRPIPKCKCGVCVEPTGQVFPLELELYGTNIGDIVWCEEYGLVVSAEIARVFAENEITGYTEHGVEFTDWEDGSLELLKERRSFRYLYVIGKGGRARTLTPGIELVRDCEVCGNKGYSQPSSGLVLSREEYDGSDLFFCDEYRFVLISERVKLILDEVPIRNFALTEVELR
ncbi:MAG: hypothetical protein KC964_30420 [Candidatus Omnitrophica bacterium]|nr:hypothetical protein [Candidatus Omnitrophota bacterium]